MSTFSETILHAINEYRNLLRKTTPAAERRSKMHSLGLDGRFSELPDCELHNKAANIVSDLKKQLPNESEAQYTYSGRKQFIDYLTSILEQYHIHNDKVLHSTQLASRASIESIQLLALPEEKLRQEATIKRLAKANYLIARFGNEVQCKSHVDNLKKHRERNEPFFDGILNNFTATLEQFRDEPVA